MASLYDVTIRFSRPLKELEKEFVAETLAGVWAKDFYCEMQDERTMQFAWKHGPPDEEYLAELSRRLGHVAVGYGDAKRNVGGQMRFEYGQLTGDAEGDFVEEYLLKFCGVDVDEVARRFAISHEIYFKYRLGEETYKRGQVVEGIDDDEDGDLAEWCNENIEGRYCIFERRDGEVHLWIEDSDDLLGASLRWDVAVGY